MQYYHQLLLIAITSLFMTVACAQKPADLQSIEAVTDNGSNTQDYPYPGIEFVEVNKPGSDSGPKQLLLFVHGTPGSLSAFRSYLEDPVLQDRYHMIAVTRPGWVNRSDEKVPSLEDQARALEPLLRRDQSGLGTILMGHSYGGPVIAKTAMQYPELIAGLAFIASIADPELSGPRWYNRFAKVLPGFLLGASLKGANAEMLPLVPQLEEMLPGWQSLEVPVLVVQGDRDRLVNPQNADFLVDSLVNADVTYLPMPGKGHFILWEDNELIRDTLLDVFELSPMLACEPDYTPLPDSPETALDVAAVC